MSLERDLFGVIDTTNTNITLHLNTSRFELSCFLELSKSSCLFDLLLAKLTLGLLTFGVSEPGTTLLKHLFLIFVHINRVRLASFRLRIRVDLASS